MTYQITEGDLDAFTEGDCWVLAREINKRTGWKVFALGAFPEHVDFSKRTLNDLDWVHVVVQTPDGSYLDVDGLSTGDALVDRYENHVFGMYDWEPEEYVFEEVASKADWEALRLRQRMFPEAPVAKVSATLIREYRAGSLTVAGRYS